VRLHLTCHTKYSHDRANVKKVKQRKKLQFKIIQIVVSFITNITSWRL